MARSRPNLHTMVIRWACIQNVLKVKVEVKGHVIRTLLRFQKIASSRRQMAGSLPNLHTMVPSPACIQDVLKVKITLLQISWRVCLWKNAHSRSIFAEVMAKRNGIFLLTLYCAIAYYYQAIHNVKNLSASIIIQYFTNTTFPMKQRNCWTALLFLLREQL